MENLFWPFVFCCTTLFRSTFLVIKCQTQFSTRLTKRTLLLERIHVYVLRLYLLLSFWRDNQSFKNIFKILKQPKTGKTYKYNRESVFPPPESLAVSCPSDAPSLQNTLLCYFCSKDILLHTYNITLKIRKLTLTHYHQIHLRPHSGLTNCPNKVSHLPTVPFFW